MAESAASPPAPSLSVSSLNFFPASLISSKLPSSSSASRDSPSLITPYALEGDSSSSSGPPTTASHAIQIPLFQKITAASAGGLLTSLIVTPFDVVKTRMQSSSSLNSTQTPATTASLQQSPFKKLSFMTPRESLELNGTVDGLRKIIRNEGVSRLWRGLTPSLVMALPSTVIYYLGYEKIRDTLLHTTTTSSSSFLLTSENKIYYAPLLSGAAARVMTAVAISPLELLRTRMQASSSGSLSLFSAMTDLGVLVRQQGITAIWRGLTPTLWRDVPFSAIYWAGYESIKFHLTRFLRHHRHVSHVPNVKLSSSDQFAVAFTSGAVSGMFAATITTPFDLAKTLMQVHELDTTSANSNRGAGSSLYNHGSTASASISSGTRNSSATSSTTTSGAAAVPRVIDVLRSIVQQDGWSGLFRGLSPRIVKVAPACAIMISTYELGTRRPWGV